MKDCFGTYDGYSDGCVRCNDFDCICRTNAINGKENFTYEDGYEDGLQSKEEEILSMMDDMDLEKYDFHTIAAIQQMIKGEDVTY